MLKRRGVNCLLTCILILLIGSHARLLMAAGKSEKASEEAARTATSAPGAEASAPANPSPAAVLSELNEMRGMIDSQRKQIEKLQSTIEQQQRDLEKAVSTIAARTVPTPVSVGIARSPAPPAQESHTGSERALGEVASLVPMVPAATTATPPALQQAQKKEQEASPLQFQLGTAYFTPVGFMDFTAVFRDTDPGSNIGTNFGSIPYRTSTNVAGNLSEFRLSPQNSRLGMRIDAMVKGAKVLAYWESDFLGGTGNPPVGNISVSSNSYPFRLRLYWVDVRKGKFEFLGGQTWSLITPGRKGISPLPSDLFYSQDVDANYHAGLVWGRIPEFRMAYHASDKVTMAVALGNAEQYIGGSGGAGTIVLPTNLASSYAGQLNNGTTTLGVPNLHPDILAKIAFDPSKRIHLEIGGVVRTFKTYNPLTAQHFTTTGGGVETNLNVELVKNFRFVTNNYWSDGGGRYIFGQAPDLVVRNDGSASLVKSGSTVTGFEFVHKSFQAYTYYGGIYIGRNVILAPNNGNFVGYGFTGSANSHNRSVQEATIGFTNTFWKDTKYGALALMAQYAYFTRNPWYVASGAPKNTHMNEVFLNLRYSLPGSAPTLK
jgi:hypothetical protein